MRRMLMPVLPSLVLLSACPAPNPDGGVSDGGGLDAGRDAGMIADAGGSDANTPDASVPAPQVVINEFMALNTITLTDENNESDDWLELFNPGTTAVNLEGATITDDPLVPNRHVFDGTVIIPAGGYLVIFADGQPEQGSLHLPFRLSGSGETLRLAWTDGSTMDEVTFGAQVDDVSEGRFPDGTGAFIAMTIPTPGAANTNEMRDAGPPVDAGPFDAGVPSAVGVVINEIVASNVGGLQDELSEAEDWIELYNPTSEALALDHHHLSDTVSVPTLWSFPTGTTIPAGGYLIIFADNQPEQGNRHASFRLSAAGEAVVLTAPDGTTLDSTTFGALLDDQSIGRFPDGTGAFVIQSAPTPGGANAGPADAGP